MPLSRLRDEASIESVCVKTSACSGATRYVDVDGGAWVKKPMLIAVPSLSYDAVIGVAKSDFKVSDVLQEDESEVGVPFIEAHRLVSVAVAPVEICSQPRFGEPTLDPRVVARITDG